MDISENPYEQKLYQLFRSHDVESQGSLDKESLSKLCYTLELKDRETELLTTLLKDNFNKRVTFADFKEALLNLLGTGDASKTNDDYGAHAIDTISNSKCNSASPSREVSPKLIVGTKKYGRRTRPQISSSNDSSQSESDGEFVYRTVSIMGAAKEEKTSDGDTITNGNKVKRCSSHSDLNGTSSQRRRPVTATKLKRCASLPSQKPLKKEDKPSPTVQRESSVESLDCCPTESSAVPAEVIIDMWTGAGIKNAKLLLGNLGFSMKEIQISQLSLAIDDDLNGMDGCTEQNNTVTSLLKASLTLHKAEVSALQQAYRQLADENRKLHATNRDANRRSAMLAQEVDERHIHLENATRSEIRLLEQRHTEIVKDLTAKLANDREHWSSLNNKLEIRIKSLEMDDVKLRNDMSMLQEENSALESEQMTMQKQIADLLVENKKLNYDLIDLMEKHRDEESFNSDKQSEEVLELLDKISALQMENAMLRDKNDELTSEVEEKSIELSKLKVKKQQQCRAEQIENVDVAVSNNGDIELSSCAATKRRGDSPSKAKITEESPKLGKLRKCSNSTVGEETAESENNSGDWMTLNSELKQSDTSANVTTPKELSISTHDKRKDQEIDELKYKITELEEKLYSDPQNAEDVGTIKERNVELEMCLEQMRKEFEDCEDYWQEKLNEERQLYEDEQRVTNENFNDLLKKMTEYEEQFNKDDQTGRLSPIDEKCQLEQQYAELEAETEEIKVQAKKMLDEKSLEIDQLQMEITKLKFQFSKSMVDVYDGDSPASSPISYLWHQSTIQAPARDYQNPKWNSTQKSPIVEMNNDKMNIMSPISPIQRPLTPSGKETIAVLTNGIVSNGDAVSVKSQDSVASTHSVHRSFPEILCSSPNVLREDLKRLKLVELQLKDAIQELAQQRDCLVTEVEQLQEVKPMLTKAYARTNHPNLMQKIQQLEQKNRQLLNSAKQQQIYTENILQQTWQQQNSEINELRHRLEAQGIIIAEQAQRLANADVLVKDLYVENSQLSAAVQRLEQQRTRNNIILQHQGLTIVPGMP